MIISGATDSFKQELFRAIHDFGQDTFMIALYPSALTDLTPLTTQYSSTNEISGTGYTAGGTVLSVASLAMGAGVAWAQFNNVSWPGANFTARCALVYNSSKNNRSIMVLDFGQDRIFSAASNTIKFPPAGPSTSLLRIGYSR